MNTCKLKALSSVFKNFIFSGVNMLKRKMATFFEQYKDVSLMNLAMEIMPFQLSESRHKGWCARIFRTSSWRIRGKEGEERWGSEREWTVSQQIQVDKLSLFIHNFAKLRVQLTFWNMSIYKEA